MTAHGNGNGNGGVWLRAVSSVIGIGIAAVVAFNLNRMANGVDRMDDRLAVHAETIAALKAQIAGWERLYDDRFERIDLTVNRNDQRLDALERVPR